MATKKLEFCFFCLKSFEEFTPSIKQHDILQFFTMLERHLKSNFRRNEGDGTDGSLRNGFLKERCCEDCYRILNSFSDLYCQMKHLELKISWRIWSLKNIMSSAEKVVSRVEMFRKNFTKEDSDREGRNSFENVWSSRKLLIDNCARRSRRSYPNLNIRKCDDNQHNSSTLLQPVSVFNEASRSELIHSTCSNDVETNIFEHETVSTNTSKPVDSSSTKNNLESSKTQIEPTPVHALTQITSSAASLRKKNALQYKYDDKNPKFSCNKCTRIFSTRLQLKFHQHSHARQARRKDSMNSQITPTNTLDATAMPKPIIIYRNEDANDYLNSGISNLKDIVDHNISPDKQLFLEKPLLELEADGDSVPKVDFELSDVKFDNICSPNLLAGDTDNDPATWETTHEPIIEIVPVMLAVGDSKPESPKWSLTAPISSDMLLPITVESVTDTHRLRPVYKCSQCCKTFSTPEKQSLHEKTHLQLEAEVNERISTDCESEEDMSEDKYDPTCEKDSDCSSFKSDNQEDPGDLKRTQVTLDAMDTIETKRERSISPNPSADQVPLPINQKSVPKPESSKKITSIPKSECIPEAYVPPRKITTKGIYSTFECECGLKFYTMRGYRRHRKKLHEASNSSKNKTESSDTWTPAKTITELLIAKYSCPEPNCSERFVMEEELENHKKQHGTFHCEECPKILKFARNLSIHEAKHSPKSITRLKPREGNIWHCLRCDYSSPYKSHYVHHHLKEHLQVPSVFFMCPICRKSSRTIGNWRHALKKHFNNYHDVSGMDPKSVLKCSQCTAYFRTERQLVTHKTSLCKHPCSDCEKTFSSKFALVNHRFKSHVKITTPLHKCKEEKCRKVFEAEADLESHMKSSHYPGWDTPVICDICGKEVLRKYLGNHIYFKHKKGKKGQTLEICEKCGKSFKSKFSLETHYLTHDGPESWKFSCSICGRKCRDKYKLEDHERTHNKEKPFVCQVCGVSYAHRHNLRIHVNNKHSDIVQDIPKPRNKGNMPSRKGIKCKAVFNRVIDSTEHNVNDSK